MKKLVALLLAGVLCLGLAACGSSDPAPAGSSAGEQGGAASSELNIFMWGDYIDENMIADFEAANNCKINLSYMSDNADSINKLTAGAGDEYDLIMTCDAYMDSLIAGGYLEQINTANIPNTANLNEAYWVAKDYCVPYLMNYIYVIYDTETCPIEITCYNDLIDPALKGQIGSVDGARNIFPIALVALGYDPNSTNEQEIAEAYEWLVKYNDNVKAYGNVEKNIATGEISVGFTYDGNASWAMSETEPGRIAIADFDEDPIQLGMDLFVIPKGAKHIDLAEKFLDYMLVPEVMAANLDLYPYSCPNDAAVAVASETYAKDPARIFDYKENVFFQEDVGEALMVYNDFYQKLKVGE